jgi:hypothetical protein
MVQPLFAEMFSKPVKANLLYFLDDGAFVSIVPAGAISKIVFS